MKTKRIIVLAMAFLMLASVFVPTLSIFAEEIHSHEDEYYNSINYVSIGDSLANGYGFEGYEQGSYYHDFLNGIGTYGDGAYPLQFENHLKNLGYDVNHTKLAVSALRAEDLLYLLGGRDEPADDWFEEVNYYTDIYDNAILSSHYQNAVKDADIITLGIGNASFGAFMLSRITSAMGIMGGSLDYEQFEMYTLENALALLDDEDDKYKVIELYERFCEELENRVSSDIIAQYKLDAVCDIFAYTVAGFIVNYTKSIDRIVELNEKENLEIMLVGLMNTTYGMNIELNNGATLPFGDIMGEMFKILNAYIAAYPTAKQIKGEFENVTFYYAEQSNPEFIGQTFDDFVDAGWNNIDNGRLSGDLVRSRIISTYNSTLRPLFSMCLINNINAAIEHAVEDAVLDAFRDAFGISYDMMSDEDFKRLIYDLGYGNTFEDILSTEVNSRLLPHDYDLLPRITLADVEAFEDNPPMAWNNEYFFMDYEDCRNFSIALYLAVEEAIVQSESVENIPLSALQTIAGDIMSIFDGLTLDVTSPVTVYNDMAAFFTGDDILPLVKVYAIFQIGNGMCVHPTPSSHDNIANEIIDAYEGNWTAQMQTLKNTLLFIAEHGDEIYETLYQHLDEVGFIDFTVDAIDNAIAYIELTIAEMEAYLPTEIPESLKNAIIEEIYAIISTLIEIRQVLVTDSAATVEGLLKAIEDLEDDCLVHYNNIYNICIQVIHLLDGHICSSYTYNFDATCTANGTETGICDVCGEIDTREVFGTATGHSFTNYVFNYDATCVEDGTETAKCNYCDETQTRVMEHSCLGHNYTEATCTTAKTCIRCGETLGKPIPHTYEDATCTSPETCKTCGAQNGEPLGHNFENGHCTHCGIEDPNFKNENNSDINQNVFVRIWNWILDFFRKLIGFFKK